jgi:hypothetical protein
MAVSKRVRYEVLRRDNHTCRYCGGTAPDVTLTVDHVVPVALGGSDEPSNLVTACRDCNAGKTSTSPDGPIVADVSADAARWAAAMKQAAAEDRENRTAREGTLDAVAAAWPTFRRLPNGWEASVERFLDAGLSPEVIVQMAHVANEARGVGDRWGYFCGCCWKRVRQLQERASEIVSNEAPEPAPPEGLLTTWWLDSEVRNLHSTAASLWRREFGTELAMCLCVANGEEFCGDYACTVQLCGMAQALLFEPDTVKQLIVKPEGKESTNGPD